MFVLLSQDGQPFLILILAHPLPTMWEHIKHALISCVWLFVTLWTVAHQASLSMGLFQARILEWVAIPFSRGSAWPRDQTRVSCTAGKFFTIWATRAALKNKSQLQGCLPGMSLTGFPYFGRISRVCIRYLVCVFFVPPLFYFLDPIFSVLVFCSLEFLAAKLVQLPRLLP